MHVPQAREVLIFHTCIIKKRERQRETERFIQRTHPPQCLVTVIFFNCQSNVHNLYEIEKCKRIFSSRYRVDMHSTCVERSINSSSRSRHPVSGTLPHHISCPCLSTSLHYSTWYIFYYL